MNHAIVLVAAGLSLGALSLADMACAETATGAAAFGGWQTDAPGKVRKITAADVPAPYSTKPSAALPSVVAKPADAALHLPPGFVVAPFVKLDAPRAMRTAPNGDVFVSESMAGRVRVLRIKPGAAEPAENSVFAEGLDRPFGIAFYPPADPKWVYVAETNRVIRYPYRAGDLKAQGAAEIIVPSLTESKRGHWTRDVAFSPDGQRMYVSVGSGSNIAEEMPKKTPEETKAWAADHALGAAWGPETGRADVLSFDPDGKNEKAFAAGIRNCVGLAIQPGNGTVWCATNERDVLGDDVPPDYVTRVKAGAFYGWPWYYIGDHEDPRLTGQRPDLAGKVTVPDVLIQTHSAPLEETFYTAKSGPSLFPAAYRGGLFVALHGSWNRSKRTGYKIAYIPLKGGAPTGAYEDFMTGFVASDAAVWGRPVGVTVAPDGALLVSDDGGNLVWRVSYKGAR